MIEVAPYRFEKPLGADNATNPVLVPKLSLGTSRRVRGEHYSSRRGVTRRRQTNA
jgi:hypothetical protein